MKILSLICLSALISCSAINADNKRVPASLGQCRVEKHPKLDHYRLMVKNQPYNSYWYDQKYAFQLLENFNKRGKCAK